MSATTPTDGEPKVEHGFDKGKTIAQLHAEVFDPNVSDLEYFLSRCRHHGIQPTKPAKVAATQKI